MSLAAAFPVHGESDSVTLEATQTASLQRRPETGPGAPPLHIGRFEIRRELGEGAFGKVYEAFDAQLDRLVALKVAKLDRGDLEQRVKRFLREGKSAAGLRHPHIVPLFEFGQEGDLFYLVSAFIRGQTLQARLKGQTARQPRFPFRAAAEIVRRLAEALQYAHSQGIVHRDVKPGNVMLDEKDEPILLDFGLASRQEEAEHLTHDGQVLGTPLYMAPEQAKGKEGKALPESDQYALGVILYELIAGAPPFQGTPELVMYQHMEAELTSPRLKNSTISRDLETICLKCLAKNPASRYADCQALADDLRRWQEGEPIAARRASAAERTIRWTRRNPLTAVLMGSVAVSLIMGAAVSSLFAVKAEANAAKARLNERTANINAASEKQARLVSQKAESQARTAENAAKAAAKQAEIAAQKEREAAAMEQQARRQSERVGTYLRDLFAANDPQGFGLLGLRSLQERGQTLTARELLDRGAQQVQSQLDEDPLTRAALMDTIGEVYRTLGLYDAAQPLLEQSLELRRAGLPPQHPQLAESLTHVASWNLDKGFFQKAEELYEQALHIREEQGADGELPASDLLLRWALARTFIERRDAGELAKRALDIRAKRLPENHRDVAVAKAVWSAILIDSGKTLEAAAPSLEAMKFLLQESGNKDLGLQAAMAFQNGIVLRRLGQVSLAEPLLRTSVQQFQTLLGKDHIYTAIPLYELGTMLDQQGKLADAKTTFEECLEIVRKTTGLEHPRALLLVDRLASIHARQKDVNAALALWHETLSAQEARYGKTYPWRIRALVTYSNFHAQHGELTTAERLTREALELSRAGTTTRDREGVLLLQNNATYISAHGTQADRMLIQQIYDHVLDLQSRNAAEFTPEDRFTTLSNYGQILVKLGEYDHARPQLEAAIRYKAQNYLSIFRLPNTHWPAENLARAHWGRLDFPAAESAYREAWKAGSMVAANELMLLLWQREGLREAAEVSASVRASSKDVKQLAALNYSEFLLHRNSGNVGQAQESRQRLASLAMDAKDLELRVVFARTEFLMASVTDDEANRKALELAEKILADAPTLSSALWTKAHCEIRLRQRSTALEALDKVPRRALSAPDTLLRDLLIAQAGLLDENDPDRHSKLEKEKSRVKELRSRIREGSYEACSFDLLRSLMELRIAADEYP